MKLLIRIALSAFLILQSFAIAFLMWCGTILMALGNSPYAMSEITLVRITIAFGMLTLIGVVSIWWIVPPRPLLERSKYSLEAIHYSNFLRSLMALILSTLCGFFVACFGAFLTFVFMVQRLGVLLGPAGSAIVSICAGVMICLVVSVIVWRKVSPRGELAESKVRFGSRYLLRPMKAVVLSSIISLFVLGFVCLVMFIVAGGIPDGDDAFLVIMFLGFGLLTGFLTFRVALIAFWPKSADDKERTD